MVLLGVWNKNFTKKITPVACVHARNPLRARGHHKAPPAEGTRLENLIEALTVFTPARPTQNFL